MNKIKTHSDYLKSVFRHKVLIHFLRIFLAVFFVSAWEICAEKGIIDSFIFSSPKRIVKCFIELTKNGFLIRHVWKTIYETLICFIFVMITAIAAAVLMWLNRNIFKVAEPFLVLLNSLPKSALAPVLIVWLGNGNYSRRICCCIRCNAQYIYLFYRDRQGKNKINPDPRRKETSCSVLPSLSVITADNRKCHESQSGAFPCRCNHR